ncbi:NAD(P)-dependent oxidoreductase [Paenibacillus sp. CH40]|uniref:NAD-dependent epimerase/dehydratase family protein n=1 Tax=Paenibacillus sp. CH40 TaxID=2962045 RepID=UPI0020B7F635|nr:NAD(P)-dependent oxidoreductase [Paenibacillus sp. CH40]
MRTVLISGASGYIGLHIAQLLRSNNYKVITATRDSDGDIMMDFSIPSKVSVLNYHGIDAMIHTVSPTEDLYRHDPYRALSENAAGIHAAIDFCKNNNIRDFIYISSFHVFGKQSGLLREDSYVTPSNDYGLAHYTAEQTVRMFDRNKQINAWIVRPSNLFGVPANLGKFKRWNLVPFLFCKEAVEQQRITLLTPGNQIRNFVGISDVCKKILWTLEKKPVDRVIHAYGKETMSILHYANLVQKVALEKFNLPVQIIRPEGDDQVVQFQFTSLYNDLEILPEDNIEIFVNEMLKALLTY